MKKLAFIFFFIPGSCLAANLTGYWASSDGGAKVARQDLYPQGLSTNTITNMWNGQTVMPFGLRNEQIGWNLYLLNASTTSATQVSVSISSFTGTSSGIASVTVSSTNVMNWVGRPIELFYYRYIQIKGISHLVYDSTNEYEARRLPPNFRLPCTLSGNQCIPNSPALFTSRRDANKFIPDPAVPMEFIASSSFTVAAGSSQVVGFDMYIDSNQAVGTYTANITVREGVVVSTIIPVSLTVYNGRLPDRASMPVIAAYSGYNINYRHQGEHFPLNPYSEPYLTSRKRYAMLAHKHKFMMIGNDNLTNDVPSTEDVQAMNGTLFSAATGYYGPGVNTGNSHYMIGTYYNWAGSWSTTTVFGSNGFCTHASSWSLYFANNFPSVKANLYLRDESTNFTEHERFATWLTTACARTSGYQIGSFATGKFINFFSSSPHVNNPAATEIWANNVSSTTWQSNVASYLTGGTTTAWFYNSNVPGSDQIHQIEADGYGPRQAMWADWLKLSVNGIPKGGHFVWESTYFTDSNNNGQPNNNDNDLFHNTKTFGYVSVYTSFTVAGMSSIPTCDYFDIGGSTYSWAASSTSGNAPNIKGYLWSLKTGAAAVSASPSTLTKKDGFCNGEPCTCTGDVTVTASASRDPDGHPSLGRSGSLYTNMDGLLFYPGLDLATTGYFGADSNYGVNVPLSSMRAKSLRRGIQDVDYMTLAYAINPSSTTAIIRAVVTKALWETTCQDTTDCTFGYGDTPWSKNPNDYEAARLQLAQIIAAGTPVDPVSTNAPTVMKGRATFKGRAKFK